MKKTVEKGKTFMVDGPASVSLTAGTVVVFGFQLKDNRRIIIREGKRLPFTALEPSELEVSLGADAGTAETQGGTIPQSWSQAYQTVRELEKKPVAVLVVGGVDSGKSSFCTYLANRLVSDRCRVTVLDEDLGQSDIGPPSSIAYAILTSPVTDLFNVKPQNITFIGVTSPSHAPTQTIQAAAQLKTEILTQTAADYVIINTDGWTVGDEAVQFKGALAEALEPDVVFFLQRRNELPSLSAMFGDALGRFREERVDAASAAREKNREKRRSLRELGFIKYLQGARTKVFALNHITVESKEDNALIRSRQADNLLVALYDQKKGFLGIGVVRSIDYARKAIRVYTAVEEKPAFAVFGRVKLDENLREMP